MDEGYDVVRFVARNARYSSRLTLQALLSAVALFGQRGFAGHEVLQLSSTATRYYVAA